MNFKPLGEIVAVKGGKRLPKGSTLQQEPNSHPYIRVRDMGARYIPRSGLEFVPDNVFPKISRYIVNTNDVIISIVGTIGLVSVIDEFFDNASQTENCAKLTGLDKVDALYLYYFLRSEAGQSEIKMGTVGAVQPKLPLYNIEKLSIYWPLREVRQKIVSQLSTIDDKLERNAETNQTLEQIAQALFKSWFVDFDPVKAKIETLAADGSAEDAELAAMRVISAKTVDELNSLKTSNPEPFNKLAQTAAMFPAAMQDSELGEIPEGWSVSSLSELINITGGGTPKRSEELYWNGNIPWFSVKDVPTVGNVFVVDTDEKITELGLNKSSTKLLPKGTTIITARGTVGKLALVGTNMCMNQSCYGIRGKNVGDFYNYFNLKEAVSTLQRNTHGAVFDTITTQTFDTYSIAFSGADLANKFDALTAPLLQKIEANVRQNIELVSLRDTLLPKLLSGEIDLTGEVVV